MNKKTLLKSFQMIFMLAAVTATFFSCTLTAKDLEIPYDMDFSEAYSPIDVKAESDNYEILVLPDIQIKDSSEENLDEKFAFIEQVIKNADPDLIVMPGDITMGLSGVKILKELIPFLDTFKIPYAPVFGNHDAEAGPRTLLAEYLKKGKYCLFENGPTKIHGVGNYLLNIKKDDEVKYSIYMMDSNRYRTYSAKDIANSKLGGASYDFIYPDQIAWYAHNVKKNNEVNKTNINSLVFFHIALPEFREYENAKPEDIIIPQDNDGEKVCNPYVNTGFFDVMKSLGSTKGVFVGHDHVNDFVFKYQGIILGYALKTGKTCYWDEDLLGGTMITLSNNFQDIDIKHLYKKDLQ